MLCTLPEWVARADLSRPERNLMLAMQGSDFPFKWYDAATVNSALVNYTRLCPKDPFALGAHRTRLLFDVLSKYSTYCACETARAEREDSIKKSAEKLVRKSKTKSVQDSVGKDKRMKSASPFALWILSNLSCEHTEFNNTFLSLFESGKLTDKALKGNVKTAVIRLMPIQHAPFICDLYTRFYNEKLAAPKLKETI